MSIPFTQFLKPNGRQKKIFFDSSLDIEKKAWELIRKNCRFEIEELSTGEVSVECRTGDKEDGHVILALEVCSNGPGIDEVVSNLVNTAHENREIIDG